PDFSYSANKKQETPLYIAARRRGSGRLLTLLLDQLKSTAHCGPHGRTALHAAAMAGDAARQGYVGTVSKILSLYPDCCEKVDNEGLNLLHYLAFRDLSSPLRRSLFKRGGVEIAYGSVRNLMELEGVFRMTPQEVYNALRSENHFGKHHHKQKQIKELLEEIENDQVADEPVCHFGFRNISTESLEKTGDAHLVVTALIATVTFAAAITVPGGLISEKGLEQGTPLLIDEAAFKAFVVTNAIAFIFSVSALIFHLGVLDYLLAG
ncbi:hypothetical protein ERO13_D04G184133v2, partial [Gossypium hirsutum]